MSIPRFYICFSAPCPPQFGSSFAGPRRDFSFSVHMHTIVASQSCAFLASSQAPNWLDRCLLIFSPPDFRANLCQVENESLAQPRMSMSKPFPTFGHVGMSNRDGVVRPCSTSFMWLDASLPCLSRAFSAVVKLLWQDTVGVLRFSLWLFVCCTLSFSRASLKGRNRYRLMRICSHHMFYTMSMVALCSSMGYISDLPPYSLFPPELDTPLFRPNRPFPKNTYMPARSMKYGRPQQADCGISYLFHE